MDRRAPLGAAGTTLLLPVSGYSHDKEPGEDPEDQNTPVGTDEGIPRDDADVVDAGTPTIQIHVIVTGGHPDDVTPMSSSVECIEDIVLFSALFSEVTEAVRQRTEGEPVGDSFGLRQAKRRRVGGRPKTR